MIGASELDFLLLLCACAAVVTLVLIGIMVYRSWKIRGLTDPFKEHTYKKQKHG